MEKKNFDRSDKVRNKNGRLVVRNLSFNVTEEKLKEFFQSHGEVVETVILKNSNGKSRGVGFVQYQNYITAFNAMKQTNMTQLFNRKIAVDIALPKRKYDDAFKSQSSTVKSESFNESSEKFSDDENKSTLEEKDDYLEGSENEEDEPINEAPKKLWQPDNTQAPPSKKQKVSNKGPSKDVAEERTLFIRNISFDADESILADILSKFGEIKRISLCMDSVSKEFRGSAFVEFKSKEDTEACLEAYEDPAEKNNFMIDGRIIILMKAVSRQSLKDKKDSKIEESQKKDKRNIFLAREGMVRLGTLAAKGVSKKDMAIRNQREILKRKLLANPNNFVSSTRLFVQNIPLDLKDSQLKNIFKKHVPKGALLNECRIMRNMNSLDSQGHPISKGFAFVNFSKPEDSLQALRNINNNPDIFTNNQRPIIEFTIENKTAIDAREKRLKSSVEKNVTSEESSTKQKPADIPAFAGSKSNPKQKGMKALSSHIGPKIRHRDSKKGKISRKSLKKNLSKSIGRKKKQKKFKKVRSQ